MVESAATRDRGATQYLISGADGVAANGSDETFIRTAVYLRRVDFAKHLNGPDAKLRVVVALTASGTYVYQPSPQSDSDVAIMLELHAVDKRGQNLGDSVKGGVARDDVLDSSRPHETKVIRLIGIERELTRVRGDDDKLWRMRRAAALGNFETRYANAVRGSAIATAGTADMPTGVGVKYTSPWMPMPIADMFAGRAHPFDVIAAYQRLVVPSAVTLYMLSEMLVVTRGADGVRDVTRVPADGSPPIVGKYILDSEFVLPGQPVALRERRSDGSFAEKSEDTVENLIEGLVDWEDSVPTREIEELSQGRTDPMYSAFKERMQGMGVMRAIDGPTPESVGVLSEL